MKKSLILLFSLILISTIVFAQKKETRNVGEFSKLSYGVSGVLHLKQGNENSVMIEADAETLEEITTEVRGNKLVISNKSSSWWGWGSSGKATIYVTMKNIEGISVAGSGNLIGETKIKASDLDLGVSGSGDLTLDIEVQNMVDASASGSGDMMIRGICKQFDSSVSGSGRISAKLRVDEDAKMVISGSGKIEAEGTSKSVTARISGSGSVRAADLETDSCKVTISGSGSVQINVKTALDASISGSGSVSYRGNPSSVNSHSSGSGKVRKM